MTAVFTIAAGEGFDRKEFLDAAEEYCTIRIVQAATEFGTFSELATVSTGGREIGILVINSSKATTTEGCGSISFMPSGVAQELLKNKTTR